MSSENIEKRITGSTLTLNDDLAAIRKELINITQAVNALGTQCRALDAKYSDKAHASLLEALKSGLQPLKDVLAKFDGLNGFAINLANFTHHSLSDDHLKKDMAEGRVHPVATDEGFANAKLAIAEIEDPNDRMETSITVVQKIVETMLEFVMRRKNRQKKLKSLIDKSKGTKSEGIKNEVKAAKQLLKAPDSDIECLKKRVGDILELYFEARQQVVRSTLAPLIDVSNRMKSAYERMPDKEGIQALRYDCRSEVESLSSLCNWFACPPKTPDEGKAA